MGRGHSAHRRMPAGSTLLIATVAMPPRLGGGGITTENRRAGDGREEVGTVCLQPVRVANRVVSIFTSSLFLLAAHKELDHYSDQEP